jgi:asparaginyl-tRNA synthetase
MLAQVYVKDVAAWEGKEVTLRGWLHHSTTKGKLIFLQVRDGTGTIQAVVFKKNVAPEVFDLAAGLTQESSIEVTGTVARDERSPLGYELQARDLRLFHKAIDFPIGPKDHGPGFLMENRHLWLRSSKQHALLRVRARLMRAIGDFFDDRGFVRLDTPILTPAACEGTTTLFETDYFGQKAYLSQSGQLYNEANAMAFGKVYCFGPTFRAEKSKTRRHLTEFWMVEPEVAFMELDEVMELAEDFLVYLAAQVLLHCEPELKTLERDVSKLKAIQKPFPRLSYDEAAAILKAEGAEFEYGNDLGAPDEAILSSRFDRPVMVHRYPAAVKAFYMKRDPNAPDKALCVDVLAPEGYGEVIGGGQREDDYETLKRRVEEHNLPMEAFDWYLDLRRYGTVPHSGFGLGLERTVTWMAGIHHLRETIPFPRLIDHLKP